MANRDLGIGVLIGYLVLFWGLVLVFLAWITANSAPGAPQLEWGEEETFTTTKLAVVIAAEAPDADGDKVEYAYQWTKNGEIVEGKEGQSVSPKDTRKGDVWAVTVTPNDGTQDSWGCNWPWRECAGEASASIEVTVGNTAPRARIRFRDKDDAEIEEFDGKGDIKIVPSCFDPDFMDIERDKKEAEKQWALENPEAAAEKAEEAKKLAEAIAAGEAEAPEKEDPCTYTIAWWPADEEVEEGAESELTDVVLPRRTLRKSDGWKVIVIANDGEEDGEPLEEVIRKTEG